MMLLIWFYMVIYWLIVKMLLIWFCMVIYWLIGWGKYFIGTVILGINQDYVFESRLKWKWFVYSLKHYAKFKGRARREEFWSFVFYYFNIHLLLISLAIISEYLIVLWVIYAVATLIPYLAVLSRRLHDANGMVWVVLLAALIMPLIGPFILYSGLFIDSYIGDNKYGKSPKGDEYNEYVSIFKVIKNAYKNKD